MENTEIIMERLNRLDDKVQNVVNQLDQDRRDIDQLRIDNSTIKEGQKAILNQMTDFKAEIRQQVQDVIASELPKIVKKSIQSEIRLLSSKHPRKTIVGRPSVLERIKKLFIK